MSHFVPDSIDRGFSSSSLFSPPFFSFFIWLSLKSSSETWQGHIYCGGHQLVGRAKRFRKPTQNENGRSAQFPSILLFLKDVCFMCSTNGTCQSSSLMVEWLIAHRNDTNDLVDVGYKKDHSFITMLHVNRDKTFILTNQLMYYMIFI